MTLYYFSVFQNLFSHRIFSVNNRFSFCLPFYLYWVFIIRHCCNPFQSKYNFNFLRFCKMRKAFLSAEIATLLKNNSIVFAGHNIQLQIFLLHDKVNAFKANKRWLQLRDCSQATKYFDSLWLDLVSMQAFKILLRFKAYFV